MAACNASITSKIVATLIETIVLALTSLEHRLLIDDIRSDIRADALISALILPGYPSDALISDLQLLKIAQISALISERCPDIRPDIRPCIRKS